MAEPASRPIRIKTAKQIMSDFARESAQEPRQPDGDPVLSARRRSVQAEALRNDEASLRRARREEEALEAEAEAKAALAQAARARAAREAIEAEVQTEDIQTERIEGRIKHLSEDELAGSYVPGLITQGYTRQDANRMAHRMAARQRGISEEPQAEDPFTGLGRSVFERLIDRMMPPLNGPAQNGGGFLDPPKEKEKSAVERGIETLIDGFVQAGIARMNGGGQAQPPQPVTAIEALRNADSQLRSAKEILGVISSDQQPAQMAQGLIDLSILGIGKGPVPATLALEFWKANKEEERLAKEQKDRHEVEMTKAGSFERAISTLTTTAKTVGAGFFGAMREQGAATPSARAGGTEGMNPCRKCGALTLPPLDGLVDGAIIHCTACGSPNQYLASVPPADQGPIDANARIVIEQPAAPQPQQRTAATPVSAAKSTARPTARAMPPPVQMTPDADQVDGADMRQAQEGQEGQAQEGQERPSAEDEGTEAMRLSPVTWRTTPRGIPWMSVTDTVAAANGHGERR